MNNQQQQLHFLLMIDERLVEGRWGRNGFFASMIKKPGRRERGIILAHRSWTFAGFAGGWCGLVLLVCQVKNSPWKLGSKQNLFNKKSLNLLEFFKKNPAFKFFCITLPYFLKTVKKKKKQKNVCWELFGFWIIFSYCHERMYGKFWNTILSSQKWGFWICIHQVLQRLLKADGRKQRIYMNNRWPLMIDPCHQHIASCAQQQMATSNPLLTYAVPNNQSALRRTEWLAEIVVIQLD